MQNLAERTWGHRLLAVAGCGTIALGALALIWCVADVLHTLYEQSLGMSIPQSGSEAFVVYLAVMFLGLIVAWAVVTILAGVFGVRASKRRSRGSGALALGILGFSPLPVYLWMLYDLSGGFAHATLSFRPPFTLGYLYGALFALLPTLYLVSGAKIKLHARRGDRIADAGSGGDGSESTRGA